MSFDIVPYWYSWEPGSNDRLFDRWWNSNGYGSMFDESSSSKGTLATAIELTKDWASGSGPKHRVFENDEISESFRDARVVNQARNYWYEKVNAGSKTIFDGVTNFKGKAVWSGGNFGLSGIVAAGFDPMEQFVGSFTPEISSDGRTLTFCLENTTSFRSLMYGVLPDWNRSTFGMGGNMTQTFKFTEPIDFNRIR